MPDDMSRTRTGGRPPPAPRQGARVRLLSPATGLVLMAVVATAPVAILTGGVTTIIGTTGVVGLALIYAVVGAALIAFTIACSALTRHVGIGGGLHTYVARGLGQRAGMAIAAVALLSYGMLSICYFGIIGFEVTRQIKEQSGATVPWLLVVVPVLTLVGVLGTRTLRTGVIVLGVVFVVIVLAVLFFDTTAVRFPSSAGIVTDALNPASLLTGSVGAATAFVLTSYPGIEIPLALGADLRASAKSVTRSIFLAVLVVGFVATTSAWLVTVALGPDKALQEGSHNGSDLVIGYLGDHLGEGAIAVFGLMNLVAAVGAILAFHYTTAQYVRALADSGVLPHALARRNPRTGAPVAASQAVTLCTVVLLTVLALAGADPLWTVFMVLSHVGAVGVFLMLVVTSIAAMVFLLRSDSEDDDYFGWEGRLVAGVVSTLCLGAVLVLGLVEAHDRLGVPAGSPVVWVAPVVVTIAVLTGLFWHRRPNRIDRSMSSLAAYEAEPVDVPQAEDRQPSWPPRRESMPPSSAWPGTPAEGPPPTTPDQAPWTPPPRDGYQPVPRPRTEDARYERPV